METLLKISAHDNAAIKQYRKLARSRKERTKAGLFVLEGFRLVSDAVKNGAALTQLFWTEDGLARWQAEGLPTAWDGVRCAQLSDSLAAELSQTEHSQGVYAICQMPQPPALSALIHAGGSYAVLHQLQDPGNAGMILRTADALGLDGVIYSASCDIYSPKVGAGNDGLAVPCAALLCAGYCPCDGSLPVCRCGNLCGCGFRCGGTGGAMPFFRRHGNRDRQ
mgnify:CR=1 FL=1